MGPNIPEKGHITQPSSTTKNGLATRSKASASSRRRPFFASSEGSHAKRDQVIGCPFFFVLFLLGKQRKRTLNKKDGI